MAVAESTPEGVIGFLRDLQTKLQVELKQVETALNALEQEAQTSTNGAEATTRAEAEPQIEVESPQSAATPKRRGGGRPRGARSGGRANEVLAVLRENPGLKISQIASRMGIQANYLYRVLPKLAEDGKITKVGEGWQIAQPAEDAQETFAAA